MFNSIWDALASGLYQVAMNAAGMASYAGMYQPKEPESLRKQSAK
ncbi:cyclic lactone autoinducer peptide [Butyricicoccus sp. Marseille-Q5471]|nr:cyclic lactone autoinducer peptide [Butyricicoccus sp. Marseille-Q5471]